MEAKRPFSLDSRVFVEDRSLFGTVGAVLTDQGWVCIDTPADPLEAEGWRQALQAIAPVPIRAVIYTDAGRDRVLGTAVLLGERAGLVVAHHQAFERLKSHGEIGRQQMVDLLINVGLAESAEILTRTPLRLPNLTFSDRLVLRFGSPTLILQSAEGPSKGQIWVHIPEHAVVFVGDTVTLNAHPNVADPEADLERWLEQLKRLRSGRVASRIVPGRGPVVTPEGVAPVADYLKAFLKRVKTLAAAARKVELGPEVNRFLSYFPVPEYERERVQRRLRSALERLLEQYGAKEKTHRETKAKTSKKK